MTLYHNVVFIDTSTLHDMRAMLTRNLKNLPVNYQNLSQFRYPSYAEGIPCGDEEPQYRDLQDDLLNFDLIRLSPMKYTHWHYNLPERLSSIAYLTYINPAIPEHSIYFKKKVSPEEYEKLLQIFMKHFTPTDDPITKAFLRHDFAPALAEMELQQLDLKPYNYAQAGMLCIRNAEEYGFPNIFSWRKHNWGTPFNLRDAVVNLNKGYVSFTTIDGVPTPLLLFLSQEFPKTKIRHKWKIADSSDTAYHYEVIQNAKILSSSDPE